MIEVKLDAQEVQKGKGPRWSPKGEKLTLIENRNGLVSILKLGSLDANVWSVLLSKTNGSIYYNTLFIISPTLLNQISLPLWLLGILLKSILSHHSA